jgi:tRNA pseudouridine38-40 synthase
VFAKKMAWEHRSLDVEKMHEAGQYLLGKQDFSAFRAAGCQAKHPIRTVSQLHVSRQGEQVQIDISADGFLYHMVRNITGVLLEIGRGSRPVTWTKTLLESKNRRIAAMTAPAEGLYFCGADYPPEYQLPRWTRE